MVTETKYLGKSSIGDDIAHIGDHLCLFVFIRLYVSSAFLTPPLGDPNSDIQYEKRATCNCSTVDLGEISRAFLWETYGRKVRAGPECMQCTRVHQKNAPSWLAGARAGGFQPVFLWGNVGNHARAAFSL